MLRGCTGVESRPDALGQFRAPQRRLGGARAPATNTITSAVSLWPLRGPRLLGQQAGQARRGEGALGLIERRAGKAEGRRGVADRLAGRRCTWRTISYLTWTRSCASKNSPATKSGWTASGAD